MNRKIIFRGQPVGKGGMWIEGIGAYKTNTAEHLVIDAKGNSFEVVHLCQYTGLKDKTGKKIFEGDILNLNGLDGDLLEVRFVRGVFAFLWNGKLDDECVTTAPTHEWAEVVGNIYDNPEILKGGEK